MVAKRRWVTQFAVLLVVALMLAACPPAEEPPPVVEEAPPTPAPEVPEAPPSEFSEAPALAEAVQRGELPVVDERLPDEPFVVGPGVLITEEDLPDWTPGRYGGTLRSAHSVADWAPDVFVMMNEPLLIAPGIGTDGIQGNIVREVEVSDDNQVFTFHLREGLQWSDGHPVTTEDVLFVYEDILQNEQLTTAFPTRFRVGDSPTGEPMELEVLDDYTFRITFAEPYGGFLRQLTIEKWVGYTELLLPKHHLTPYHINYTSLEEMRPLLDEAGFEDEWWLLFEQIRCLNWDQTNPRCAGHPMLTPWVPVEAPLGLLRFERNPYYFKVDTQGQQLPYIDAIVSVQVEDVEAVNLQAITGELDFLRESTALVNVPLYRENEERAGIRTILTDMHVNSSTLMLNQTFEDDVWREVVRDIRFRQALSHAIDRGEIIDSIYFGFASIPVLTVGEDQSEYNPERASQLLDEMGLDQRDAEGYRLGPDGATFSVPIEHAGHAPDLPLVAELLVEHLRDVGLRTTVRRIDPGLWGQRNTGNELMATTFWAHDQGWDDHRIIGPLSWSQLWHLWRNTAGSEGEEPPDWAKEGYDLNTQRWRALSGSDEYLQIKDEEFAWHRENLPIITLVEDVKYPMIASQRLGNMPRSGYAIAANFSAEQFFYTE